MNYKSITTKYELKVYYYKIWIKSLLLPSAVKERCLQYIHDLYKDEKRSIRPDYVGDDGPSIT